MQITSVSVRGKNGSAVLVRNTSRQVDCLPTPSGSLFPLCATVDEEPGYDDVVIWFSAARSLAKMVDGITTQSSIQDAAEILESLSKGE